MENDRSDPPLTALCPHQVPRRKFPECGTELRDPSATAADLIKSIVALVTR
jgi:hypothetical protein